MNTNDEIAAAKAAVQSAQSRVDELLNVQAAINNELPKARDALTRAHAALRKLKVPGAQARAQQTEIEQLRARIAAEGAQA
ncbi:hypothetical protein D3C80_1954620 [compost metagenome]